VATDTDFGASTCFDIEDRFIPPVDMKFIASEARDIQQVIDVNRTIAQPLKRIDEGTRERRIATRRTHDDVF
jgi:hypothetical protein